MLGVAEADVEQAQALKKRRFMDPSRDAWRSGWTGTWEAVQCASHGPRTTSRGCTTAAPW